MRALVTGGSGYFGSLLINKLINKGFNVGSLDINKPEVLSSEVPFHQVDIRDYNALKKNLAGYDLVFHNVAQVPLAKNKTLFWEVNVQGTTNICRASVENNVRKLIYTSSSAIYGIPQCNPVDEKTIPIPGESYGKAKLEGEKICFDYHKKGIDVAVVRPRTIMGHGRLGIFSILFNWVSEGINIPVLDDGKNIYQFVHADDLAEACILASKNNSKYSSYNIGASDYTTMRKTLESLCAYAGTGSKVYSLPLKPIEIGMNVFSKLNLIPLGHYHSLMYGRSLYFNTSKAKEELGFESKVTTNEMFSESYEWYLKNIKNEKLNIKGSSHQKPINQALLRMFKLFS